MFIMIPCDYQFKAKLISEKVRIFVGHVFGHTVGVCQILNLKKIILTRDVTSLRKSYGKWAKIEKPAFVQV